MKRQHKPKKDRHQLALELDEILKIFEDAFIIKLRKFFERITNKLLKAAKSLPLFQKQLSNLNPEHMDQLKNLMQKYYKQIGKASINHLNKEIKILSGKNSSIKIPDINEGLRYRAEQQAIKKLNDFRRALIENVINSPGDKSDKNALISTIKHASRVFINRNVTIVSRMESVTAANDQRLEACKKSTIVKGVQFLAVLDKRTTVICHSRHAMVIRLDDPLLPNFKPPCHWGCRSLLSPVTIYEDLAFTSIEDLKKVPPKEFKKPVKTAKPDKSSKDNSNKNQDNQPPPQPKKKKVLNEKDLKDIVHMEENGILLRTGNKVEQAMAFDKFGNILLSKIGTKSSVSFTASEGKQMYGARVFTHNHPSSSSFSWDDFDTAIVLRFQELRAIAPDSIYGRASFVMKDFLNVDVKEAEKVYNRIRRQVLKVYQSEAIKFRWTDIKYTQVTSNETWRQVSKELNFKYYWEKLDG